MKLRPQFQLRLRDAAQFERMRDGAEAAGLSLNEYILAALEARMAEDQVATSMRDVQSSRFDGGSTR